MLADIKPKYDSPTVGSKKGTYGNIPKKKKTLPAGITKKESYFAQTTTTGERFRTLSNNNRKLTIK